MNSEDAIRKALKKKRELEVEIKRLDEFIRLYEELMGTKVIQDEMLSPGDVAPQKTGQKQGIRLRFSGKAATPAKIAEVAASLIREIGAPIQRGQLVKLVEDRGLRINSEDKARYLGTILWRHNDQFTNVDGRGYWLQELGTPPEE